MQVYLDNHATTPVDPRVFEAMAPYFTQKFGNPASNSHSFGWAAAEAVQKARAQVAALIGAQAREIVFTSGATESNNLALKGIIQAALRQHPHAQVIVTTIEHSAVLDPVARLEAQLGPEALSVTRLAVGRDGRVSLDELKAALRPETVLVSVIAANNEIGVIQDMEAIGALVHAHGALLHTDATQAVGKIPVAVNAWQVDLLSLSGHKMYAPKGIGALYVRGETSLISQLDGGGHERGVRSGTLNVPGIVALGAAAQIAQTEMGEEADRLRRLRDRLRAGIVDRLDGVRVNGSWDHRLPHNLHLTFEGVEAELLMMSANDIAISSGSACTSAKRASSHVLRALGLSDDEAHRSLRFGLGRFTTEEEIDYAAGRIVEAVGQLRPLSLP